MKLSEEFENVIIGLVGKHTLSPEEMRVLDAAARKLEEYETQEHIRTHYHDVDRFYQKGEPD